MKQSGMMVLTLVLIATLTTGCAMSVNPLVGALYCDGLMGPLAATSNTQGDKVGEATATMICGFSKGDSSIKTAAANGGINKIKTIDTRVKNIAGVYMEVTTIVTGD